VTDWVVTRKEWFDGKRRWLTAWGRWTTNANEAGWFPKALAERYARGFLNAVVGPRLVVVSPRKS
jgi:hypothetical protein